MIGRIELVIDISRAVGGMTCRVGVGDVHYTEPRFVLVKPF